MKTLLLAAHGSKRDAANQEVIAIAKTLADRSRGTFDAVLAGFMQFASPSIVDQIAALVRSGATEIVVLPYFIASGSHVLIDIPAQVAAARAENPHVNFRLMPHLGKLPGVIDIILAQV